VVQTAVENPIDLLHPISLPQAQAIIVAQQNQISQLEDRNAQLEARLEELEARLNSNSSNSSKPPVRRRH
jgi:hypothetical protein